VELGDFREDLFYRLNVLKIYIPPLRERKEDIPILTNHFVSKIAKMLGKKIEGVDSKVFQIFNDYPWPGNVRELQNSVERAINFAKESIIRVEDLQENLTKFLDQKNNLLEP
jgi:transcriptional regulator with PAS, ATPase and Fis domain